MLTTCNNTVYEYSFYCRLLLFVEIIPWLFWFICYSIFFSSTIFPVLFHYTVIITPDEYTNE